MTNHVLDTNNTVLGSTYGRKTDLYNKSRYDIYSYIYINTPDSPFIFYIDRQQ